MASLRRTQIYYLLAAAAAAPALVAAAGQQDPWKQCSGSSWNGPTTCVEGFYCHMVNEWYSHCIPGNGDTSPPDDDPTEPPPAVSPGVSPETTPAYNATGTSEPPTAAPTTPPAAGSFDEAIKAKGKKYFGTAADKDELNDPSFAAIVKSHYGQLTPGNSMKWDATEKTKGTFTFDRADFLVDWATANGKIVRGHCLVWHSQLPAWVSQITDAAELTSAIENHIKNVAGRYAGKLYAWDVVNEMFNEDGTWRKSVFYNILGESYIEIALRAARKADPTAKLYLNEYNLDYPGPKLNAMVALVKDLVAKDCPIDGIGSQAHLSVGDDAIEGIKGPIKTLADTGVDVALTEVDIRMPTPADATKLANQSKDYNTVVSACMQVPGCIGVTTWGFTDKFSWIPSTFPGKGAALPWDEKYNKKPAVDGILKALSG